MHKVILYGAADGGLCVSRHLINCEIIAYVDDNQEKEGKLFNGKPIIGSKKIIEYRYDYIIISCVHGQKIMKYLTDDLKISPKFIIDYYHHQNKKFFDTRIAMLRLLAEEIYENNIQGNIAELGVYQGEFSSYMSECFFDRRLYLFDTFEGFQENDVNFEKKNAYSDAKVADFGDTNMTLVKEKMKHDNYVIVQGYFPESVECIEDKFAFVSLDVDLYKPIYHGLEYFYPRLAKGGYLMIHDYNGTVYRGVKLAVKEFCEKYDVISIPITDHCGSAIIKK